jgi:predicted ATPase
VPVTLDNIIAKLLIKEPEERYQSTYAVISDLKKATDLFLLDPDFSENFTVALDDVPEQLSIPNRLYDRESVIGELRDSIELAQNGSPVPVTINGEPGTGKSAVLREASRLTLELGGSLCLFKATLVNKDVPLSSVIDMLTEISRQLLSRSDLSQLQSHLQSQLGHQIAYLIEICPEVQRIFSGRITSGDRSQNQDAMSRIKEAFSDFISSVADYTRPLVIAVDNAYWLDEGSMELLTHLSQEKPQGLFLVIAGRPIRDPDTQYFERFHKLSRRIHVGNLDATSLRFLLGSCTFRSPEEVEDLSLVTLNKTQGNPQSVREFLNDIYHQKLLYFDRQHREWSWDLNAINQSQPTSNVGQVLATNLDALDKNTVEILKIASCIGDRFDLDTIKRVSGMSFSQTSACLIQAVAEGFLLYTDVTKKSCYMFAHEQIQQTAYQMLDSIERHQIHAQIGRTYLTLDDSGDRIFEVVNQLNNSIDDSNSSPSDRLELAKLNLTAGRKAKNSAAFQASFRYLRTALAVQGKDVWSHYELALETHLEAAEAAYFCGDRDQLDSLIAAILDKTSNPLDKAKAYEIQLRALIAYNEVEEALGVGHQALHLLGYKMPRHIGKGKVLLNTVRSLLLARSASKVRKKMKDPYQLAAMRLLMIMCQAGYLASKPITAAYTLKMAELSIRGGLSPESSFAYSMFGALVIRYFGTINLGFEFGQLALENLDESDAEMFCRTNVVVHNFVSSWKQHLRHSLEPLAAAEKIGFEHGDIEFAQIAATTYCINGFIVGQDLNTLDVSFKQKNDNAVEFNQTPMLAVGTVFQQTVQNLIKNPRKPWLLRGPLYDERELVQAHIADKDYTSLATVYIAKTFLAFVFREFELAKEYSGHARLMLDALVSSPLVPFFTIFESLVYINHLRVEDLVASTRTRIRIRKNLRDLRKWSQHAPMNIEAGYQLVMAEFSRVNGQDTKAVEHYDRAINAAEQYGQTHLFSLAQELTGRFYERKNQTSLSNYFLLRARSSYVRWGAVTKVNALDREYRELAEQGAQYVRRPLPLIDSTEQAYTDHMDLGSVIKASQVLSGEIILDTLLEKLMQVALENAGAHSAGLVLTEGEDLCVEILSRYNGVNTDHRRQRIPIAECYDVPASVIQYVARTEEDLVLNDASNEDIFTQDAYIANVKPRSILCFPILSKSHLTGVLYLENLQTTSAFSEDRVAVLKLLASQ